MDDVANYSEESDNNDNANNNLESEIQTEDTSEFQFIYYIIMINILQI